VSTEWTLDRVTGSLVHSEPLQTRQTERVHTRQLARTRVNLIANNSISYCAPTVGGH